MTKDEIRALSVGDIIENSYGIKYTRIAGIHYAGGQYFSVNHCVGPTGRSHWSSSTMIDGCHFKRKLPAEEVVVLKLQGILP